MGHQILQYQPCCFCGKEKNLPRSGCPLLCSNDSSLPLSVFCSLRKKKEKKKKHPYTQPMGTSLQRGSLEENNADLSSSRCGSTGNNKSGCVVCWESELSVWCQQRLNSNYKRHNKTHLLDETSRNAKTAIWDFRHGYICINQSHTKFKYINEILAIIPLIIMTVKHVH